MNSPISIRCGQFLEEPMKYWLLKKFSALWICYIQLYNKGNVRIKGRVRRVRVTIVAVEKQ
jgi:hypothetical protein